LPARSLWDDTVPDHERRHHRPLPGDVAVDVAIVGAGLTGLWTAYYLAAADPTLRIVVLERDTVGFGASGRNGGWCSALMPMSLTTIARRHGRPAARRLQRAMNDTVGEVARVVTAESIDCGFVASGTLDLVRSEPQRARALSHLDEVGSFGFGDDHRWLSASEAAQECRATNLLAAVHHRHCATVHPARLVHGVAAAAVRAGVTIHEHTEVERIEPHRVHTSHGTVSAEVIVRATEGYTPTLPGARRDLLPLYSMMIATEPLPADTWDQIGLHQRPTFADGRHSIIYGQRTVDGRIAFGGRGAPYHFGSAVRPGFDTDSRVRQLLIDALEELFPALSGVEISHHWGGPLGVPRDWHASARLDRSTGLAAAGGYVGDGVAFTNLAGRTLADLITGHDSDLVRLPWVGHRSRRWEPEPLRWLGINLARHAASRADRTEARTGRSSRIWGTVMSVLLDR
jgi:glycine/D-amino acid oxidase-like deaminating enzyme